MKGFIRTLEGIIASTLLLSTALFVAPQLQEEESYADPAREVRTALESLEESGRLDSGSNRSEVRSLISDSVPEAFSYRVLKQSRDLEKRRVDFTGSEEQSLDRSGSRFGAQFFIDSSSNLDVNFSDQRILKDIDGQGYVQEEIVNGTGEMNFSGSADLQLRFYNWSTSGSTPEVRNVEAVSFPLSQGEEVRVLLWRDRSS